MIINFELLVAVEHFWRSKGDSKLNQDNRQSVLSGKNMDMFAELIVNYIDNKLSSDFKVHRKRKVVTLPGYFRPTKQWDLVIMKNDKLVAAIEFKSQVACLGNNFNNRAEEAIGSALDFWTAYREGAFGKIERPFLGWLILVEDSEQSNRSRNTISPHFPLFKEFEEASYLQRYQILCDKLMLESLYSSCGLIKSPIPKNKKPSFSSYESSTDPLEFYSRLLSRLSPESML